MKEFLKKTRELSWEYIVFSIYLVCSIIFCSLLNSYNKKLTGKNPLEVMLYENGSSWNYLIWAFVLIIAGCVILSVFWKFRNKVSNTESVLTLLGLIILTAVIIIILIYFIQNPILRAVAILFLGGSSVMAALND